MYVNAVKLVQLLQIKTQNVKINRINPFIAKYWDNEFLLNPAKWLTELFSRNTKFSKWCQMNLKAMKIIK